jgi:hypothetical protein
VGIDAMSTRVGVASLVATLLLLAGVALAGGGAGVARAASANIFGPATARSTFQVGIDLTEPATIPAGVKRLEALVATGGDTQTSVTDVPVPAAGATTLSYHLAVQPGDIIPNTVLQRSFRITLADGTQEEGPVATVRYRDTRFAWKTLVGQYVTVHWTQGDDAFGRRAMAIGDKAIADVSALLGVTETAPIDFFIYPDPTTFYDVLGPAVRENVGGVAFPGIRTLLADIAPTAVNDPWVGIVIPHELTHLVFGTATDNPYHQPPHWLNEGLAVYLSQGYVAGDRSSVAQAAADGSIMPLTAIDGQFPTTQERFSLAYAESVSAIDYLIRTYGQDALVKLIRSYANGVSDDAAFSSALGVNVAGFETGWLDGLGIAEPKPFGPQPAPAGPLPSGWGGAGPTAGTAAGGLASPIGPTTGGTSGGPDLVLVGVLTALVTFGVIGGIAFVMGRRRRGTGS